MTGSRFIMIFILSQLSINNLSAIKEHKMSFFKTLCIAIIVSSLVIACSSAERRAYKSEAEANESQAELNKRKIEIVNDYEKCVNKSETAEDLAKCEALLKAAEGL